MSKRRSKIKFAILSIIAAIGIFLCVASFQLPWDTTQTYKGFANSISLGLDIKGGVLAVYEASVDPEFENEFDTRLNATMVRLESLLTSKGFTEATVSKQGSNRIRIEVPNVSNPDDLFEAIGEPATIKITDDNESEVLLGKHIVSAEASYQNGEYGVVLKFNNAGSKIFERLTGNNAGGNINIYIGDMETPFSSPKVSEAISGGVTFINGMKNQPDAEEYAMKILSGTFSVELNKISSSVISATLGADALQLGLIAGAIGVLAILIFMVAYYGILGLLADFSLIFYGIIFVFLLQAIPLVQLTLPGIAGIFLSLGMAVDGNIVIFERIKEEYRSGKKIPASIKSGFKNALASILDGNITTIISAVVLYLLGTGPIKGFAIVLLIGNIVSMFSSIIITRGLINMYLPINSINPKPYKLKREGRVNEA